MKKVILILSLIILIIIAGCTQQKGVIKVGVLLPLTGDAASYGTNSKNGVEIALQEINQESNKFELIYEDGKCVGKDSVNAIQKLISIDKVQMVIGEMCSSATLAALPVANTNKVVLISPASTSPDLSGSSKYFFRTVPSDALQGKEGAKLVDSLGYKRLAVLYVNDDYGIGFKDVLKQEFKGEFTGSETFEKGATDLKTQLSKLNEDNPDAIYIISNSPSAVVVALKQIKELDINAKVFGSEGLKDKSVLEPAGEAAEGLILTFLAQNTDENWKSFRDKYFNAYNEEPGAFSAESYDALKALYLASTMDLSPGGIKCKDVTGDCIADNLLELSFNGASGLIDFNEQGDVVKGYNILTVKNGEFVNFEQ